MSRSDYVNSVLSALAGDLGLPNVTLDANDRATLAFDDMEVAFLYTTQPVELLWLYADLGEIPAEGDPAPAFLLQVGLGSWALGRMTIGLDDQGRRAKGYTSIPVSLLDPPMLHKTLTALLEVALPVHKRLAERDFQLTPPPAGEASGQIEPGLRA